MNLSLDNDPKIKELKKDIEQLEQDYESLRKEARNAPTLVDQKRLERRAENIYDELRIKKEELQELEEDLKHPIRLKDPNRSHIDAEKNLLLSFDYKRTLKRFTKIIDKFGKRGGAGVFVLEKYLSKGGKYCRRKLIYELNKNKKRSQGKFFEHPLHLRTSQPNKQIFLQRLAEQLQVNINSEFLIRDVIEQIHSLFREDDSGVTHLFYVFGDENDLLLKEKSFWDWFLDEFSTELIQDSPDHPYLKLIFLFELDVNIPRAISHDYICTSIASFTPNKIVKLPIQKCPMNEIEYWLYNDSGFSKPVCDQVLQTIEEATELIPDRVYDKFLKLLTQ